MRYPVSFSVVLAAGSAVLATHAGAAQDPIASLRAAAAPAGHWAHIYYNLATGERVVTLGDAGAGTERSPGGDSVSSDPVWSSLVSTPCAPFGGTTALFFPLDNPGSTSLSTGVTLSDYGDIAHDTVIDCVRLNWVTQHPDTDDDSDGAGDGVLGLRGQWTWWDLDNGREANACGRTPLASIMLFNLPGHLGAPGATSSYSMTVDLDRSGMSFEICDTDGDPQGAAIHNPLIGTLDHDLDGNLDSDLDGDGLSDWGWTVRFFQPAGADPDTDATGVSFGVPEGSAVDNGDGTWAWLIDTTTPDAGTGAEDRFALYTAPNASGDIFYAGGFWFGGFSCTPGVASQYTPFAMFEHQLLSPGGGDCGPADLSNDGRLDYFDVSAFRKEFANGGDYNGDGSTDALDASDFFADYSAGCS